MTFDLGSEEFHQPTDELGLITAAEFVLPNPEDGPAASAQSAIYAAVAGLVALNLLPPKGGVGLGLGAVPEAAVPEAAVHKHRGLQFWENKVRFARQLGASPPARDAVRPENLNQPQLGVLVVR